ncbi:RNA binding protein, heterogenous nuclear RNP-K like protein [Thoreauomyces humboldtii]|nr:RNA binding protein, heterogenous nuclear RNP-K like protein [Thoreauomyces humboldtii]
MTTNTIQPTEAPSTATPSASTAAKQLPRRASPYDEMVRLTGLSLDPEFPPQHVPAPTSAETSSSVPVASSSSSSPTAAVPAVKEVAVPAPITINPNNNHHHHHQNGPNGEYDDSALYTPHHSHHNNLIADGSSAPILTLRALVSTREAGVIIGKAGKNVAEVRDATGVKAGVSKVHQGVHERVLTVAGSIDALSKAFFLVAKHLLDNPISESPRTPAAPQQTPFGDFATVRLLVAHQLMGSVIGKGGSRIRDIQEESGAKITVSKDILPQSTERTVEIYGYAESIQIAVYQIGECILNDIDRVNGTIFYSPENRIGGGDLEQLGRGHNDRRRSNNNATHQRRPSGDAATIPGSTNPAPRRSSNRNGSASAAGQQRPVSDDDRVESLGIPVELVGSIIGRGGSFINAIRKASGARLRIEEVAEGQHERVVTITGPEQATKTALEMIYAQLEAEKHKRIAGQVDGQPQQQQQQQGDAQY